MTIRQRLCGYHSDSKMREVSGEGLRQAMKLVGFKNVAEVIRPGLGPTGEWREFLGFAR